MNVGADQARNELLNVLRDFLSKREATAPAGSTGAQLDRAWWRQLANLGVFALAIPEDQGGLGVGLIGAAVAFEALGQARTPGPLVWSQLAAFELPEAASGEGVVAGVDLDRQSPDDPILVANLVHADKLLTLSERGVVVYDRSEIQATALSSPIDPDTPVARIDTLRGGDVIADPARAERLRRIGTLLSAATLLGVSEAAIQVATEYAQGRHQFGRPIGSFQAIKHLLADAYTSTNLARAAVYAAAELGETWQPGAPGFDLSAAKLLAGRAADANARTAVQVFGGMGFAWETPPHLLLKRAWLLENEFGTMHEHALSVSEIMAAPADSGAEALAGAGAMT